MAFRLLEDEFEELRAELSLARSHLEDAAADAAERTAFDRLACSGRRSGSCETTPESGWARSSPRIAVGLSIVGTAVAATGLGLSVHGGGSSAAGWMVVGGVVFDLLGLALVY
ncbi:hypothetical protein AKJ08_3349 [Vulgatibacter incomptus]|uniref:Uncharacterized protein n=1 Tax=Vulgatibacter incomptus TaxID=1391653 RepID=A0A0K1PHH4_9BACT|nr:hypothetical protein AKJ08_3349 [Vulgatibacter incomptus]